VLRLRSAPILPIVRECPTPYAVGGNSTSSPEWGTPILPTARVSILDDWEGGDEMRRVFLRVAAGLSTLAALVFAGGAAWKA
jgi:hypothetical protein